jgi:putative solute:sodium symporter small subunit
MTPEDDRSERNERARAYWRANLKLSAALLAVWFLVSFGFGILFVEPLNRVPFFGFKLGFWWAQQGSIYAFIVLIFVYAAAMKRLDRKYDVHEDD